MAKAKVTTTVSTEIIAELKCETSDERRVLGLLLLKGSEYTDTETEEDKLIRQELSRAYRAPETESLTEHN